ncbi:MAG: DedA family protein [Clostridium sp.]|uniref:DedA family protein n=1 Tax=Clostridium sp. TaxID=1506 RepID=UPI002A8E1520|nr:DedA family protein [Clostridium sp.]MDY5098899.1 DedA family protein [Clostridium sp.]
MDASNLTNYFYQYGSLFVFIIVFLEYLNLPGLPGGIIMPMAGVWAATGNMSLISAILLSVLAGVLGSWVLYSIGRFGGNFLLEKYLKRFPKHEKYINEKIEFLREKGNIGVFISKLIPVARTLISLPAGLLKMNFLKYSLYSALGILVWNCTFISAGYFFSTTVIHMIG